MADPVHHVEVCVTNVDVALKRFSCYGFQLYATREKPGIFRQYVIRLQQSSIFFILTERQSEDVSMYVADNEFPVMFCCSSRHTVDSVFNVALNITRVDDLTEFCEKKCPGSTIIPPSTIVTENGSSIRLSTIKSVVGNVIHTCINVTNYSEDEFLPGFEKVHETKEITESDFCDSKINRIDHVTLATRCGFSSKALSFYQNCFGMEQFSISSDDNENEGLILSVEGSIGLRLRAMEFYRCSETYLTFDESNINKKPNKRDRTRKPNSLMLVVVESLPGQMNCNVESFIKCHGPGVEHIAFFSQNIIADISLLTKSGVGFRKPPDSYYTEIIKNPRIKQLAEFPDLRKLGILIDLESDADSQDDQRGVAKIIMQIFAHPVFQKNTFFIEIIHRVNEARGLGARNIIALVRSIRQDKSLLQETGSEALSSPRRIC